MRSTDEKRAGKPELKQTFHPEGGLAAEVTLINGLPNGVTRFWHANGVLAKELPVKDGVVEGIAKQWNTKGGLLGSYEIRGGCGIAKEWYDNGQLMGETTFLDGAFTGRQRDWFEDGQPAGVSFWIKNLKVSADRYQTACKDNPRLPRYDD